MNKTETERQIEVMQAYVDGESIEYNRFGSNGWIPCPNPNWDFVEYSYRVKVEPREYTICVYKKSGDIVNWNQSREEHREQGPMDKIKVREVL